MAEEQEIELNLDDDTTAALEHEAKKRGVSVEVLAKHLMLEQLRMRTAPRRGTGVVRPFQRRA